MTKQIFVIHYGKWTETKSSPNLFSDGKQQQQTKMENKNTKRCNTTDFQKCNLSTLGIYSATDFIYERMRGQEKKRLKEKKTDVFNPKLSTSLSQSVAKNTSPTSILV